MPDELVKATADSCTADIVELLIPKLIAMQLKYNIHPSQFHDFCIDVTYMVNDGMDRAGKMALDIARDTLKI